jgi:hypothetical protein
LNGIERASSLEASNLSSSGSRPALRAVRAAGPLTVLRALLFWVSALVSDLAAGFVPREFEALVLRVGMQRHSP